MLCKSNTAIQWDFTVSPGLFLSTMISWNTEPQTNWKLFNTHLNVSSSSLSFVLEYSHRGLWHSVQVTVLPMFNAVCADGEKGIAWPLLEGFFSLEGMNFSYRSSLWWLCSFPSSSLCSIGLPKFSIFSFPLTGK